MPDVAASAQTAWEIYVYFVEGPPVTVIAELAADPAEQELDRAGRQESHFYLTGSLGPMVARKVLGISEEDQYNCNVDQLATEVEPYITASIVGGLTTALIELHEKYSAEELAAMRRRAFGTSW
jgi:methionine synthase I (cobalamin-dependent)